MTREIKKIKGFISEAILSNDNAGAALALEKAVADAKEIPGYGEHIAALMTGPMGGRVTGGTVIPPTGRDETNYRAAALGHYLETVVEWLR